MRREHGLNAIPNATRACNSGHRKGDYCLATNTRNKLVVFIESALAVSFAVGFFYSALFPFPGSVRINELSARSLVVALLTLKIFSTARFSRSIRSVFVVLTVVIFGITMLSEAGMAKPVAIVILTSYGLFLCVVLARVGMRENAEYFLYQAVLIFVLAQQVGYGKNSLSMRSDIILISALLLTAVLRFAFFRK